MLGKKIVSFAIITLSSTVLFTNLIGVAYIVSNIIRDGSIRNFPSGGEVVLLFSIFIGITQALIFTILEWRKKSESIIHIFLSTFLVAELIMLAGFVNFYLATTGYDFQNIDLNHILLSAQIFPFVRNSLILVAFSAVSAIVNKHLLIRIKNIYSIP